MNQCRFGVRSVHREDRPPNSKFFPGSFNLDYDNSRDRDPRDYGRAVRSALLRPLLVSKDPRGFLARNVSSYSLDWQLKKINSLPLWISVGFDDSTVNMKESVGEEGGSPLPIIQFAPTIQAWFSSQSNFVTFVYPSDGSPFGGSLGTDSLCVDWLNAESLPLAGDRVFHRISRYSCQHSHFWYLQVLSPKTFPDWQNVPLLTLEKAAFKVSSLRWITWAPIHFRCHGARPVSYYAFFKGWLLPSPPPGFHRSITSFSTKWLLRDLSVRSGLFPSRLWILAPMKSVCTKDDGLYSEFPWGW